MLLWQPQNSLRIRSVFFVSLALHLFVCFALLFVYKDYHQRLVVDLSSRIPSNAIVKLLPLSASRPSSSSFAKASEDRQVLGVKGGGKNSKKGMQKSGKKSKAQQVKKKAPTSLVKQIVTSKSAKAAKSKKEALEKAKKSAQTKKEKLKEQNEVKKKEAEKLKQDEKLAQSSAAKAKEDREVKEVAEKEALKSKAPEVTESVKQEQISEALQQPILDQATLGESAVGPEGQEILYLTKQEFDALQIQQKLQECLFDLWTPPAGIPPGALCEALITIGWDGVILETQFLKKTDILMYDLSVQETLEQVTFPHEVWGKQITIAFKP